MSHDSYLFIDTPASEDTFAVYLRTSHNLRSNQGWLSGPYLNLVVRAWNEGDRVLSQVRFGPATLVVKFIPQSSDEGFAAQTRVLAGILKTYPGDASFEFGEGGVELLRRGGTVYVDPNGVTPDELAGYGYRPRCVVIGIPNNTAA